MLHLLGGLLPLTRSPDSLYFGGGIFGGTSLFMGTSSGLTCRDPFLHPPKLCLRGGVSVGFYFLVGLFIFPIIPSFFLHLLLILLRLINHA